MSSDQEEDEWMAEIDLLAMRYFDQSMARNDFFPMYIEYLNSGGTLAPKRWWQAWVVECEKQMSADAHRLTPDRVEWIGDYLVRLMAWAAGEAEYQSWSERQQSTPV